jgi:hypothetical protein
MILDSCRENGECVGAGDGGGGGGRKEKTYMCHWRACTRMSAHFLEAGSRRRMHHLLLGDCSIGDRSYSQDPEE